MTGSSLDDFGADDFLASTRQMDDDIARQFPDLRSTAQNYKYYNPQPPAPNPTTSVVRREFLDFDQDGISGEDSISVELGRGNKKSVRNTPSKSNQSLSDINAVLSIGNDSLYELTATPPIRPRTIPRKSDGLEQSSLRREAQIRRATSAPQKDINASLARIGKQGERVSPEKPQERRKSTLADMHAKVSSEEEDNSLYRPPTITSTFRNTRFGASRQTSGAGNGLSTPPRAEKTPRRAALGTQRSAGLTSANPNTTAQSFMLPDLPNLTELMSGVYQDGTPVFSRTSKARARFTSNTNARNSGNDPSNHLPVRSVPMPEEEKAIFASLHLLREKVAQLEHEKAEFEQKTKEFENDNIQLRTEILALESARRPDSALGSDGEGGKNNWRTERLKLEASLNSLQNRLDSAERKASVAEITTKRITQERDNLVTQLGVAFYNAEELKAENETSQKENTELRDEVDTLRTENEVLRQEVEDYSNQLARIHSEHQDDTKKWKKKETDLLRKVGTTDRAIYRENETLRTELRRVQSQREEETQNLTKLEAEIRKCAEQEARAEHAQLLAENGDLKTQLERAKAERDREMLRWNRKEQQMKKVIDLRDETIQGLREEPQEEANDILRRENEEMRVQLAQVKAQRASTLKRDVGKETQSQRRSIETAAKDDTDARRPRWVGKLREKAPETGPSASGQEKNNLGERTGRKSAAASQHAERSRSKSQTRAFSKRVSAKDRHSSAPVTQPYDLGTGYSDAESTTDLDFSGTRSRGNSLQATPKFSSKAPVEDDQDTTQLSFIPDEVVAKTRRECELDRAADREAFRKRHSLPAEFEKNDTVRSTASKHSHARSLPRKSSMKDATSNTKDFDLSIRDFARSKQNTEHSLLSQSSRRRSRTAQPEMTSAFILPDITVRIPTRPITTEEANAALDTLPPHDKANCTHCQRLMQNGEGGTVNVEIPELVPISERENDNPDATMRPVHAPIDALAMVVKELKDEIEHLKLEKAVLDARLAAHDPSIGGRERKATVKGIKKLTEAIGVKSAQVYTLYDALEGVKDRKVGITEEEVNDTLMSVGIDLTKGMAGKRVAVENGADDESSGSEGDGDAEEDDAPWEGISDTESLGGYDGRKRRSSGFGL
ncbi:hypothetical protein K402DRAFT_415223 [Aulographum hederae CBS 113979]|uniref:Cep57 centrosome microtubule-binding domain-containing protein n=1 Tax=Aulographum hederae CBS 113979 TaxID=1176131 RepID=A0A6G1GMG1_9PEZI|nr:hypothetical protein K402DRAFT_415223 [Aulographum hederae CBS 113979]